MLFYLIQILHLKPSYILMFSFRLNNLHFAPFSSASLLIPIDGEGLIVLTFWCHFRKRRLFSSYMTIN